MNWVLIMAGGAGTRFWPASRLRRPKQLLSIVSEKSLIQETVARIKPLIPTQRILILTQKQQLDGIRKALPQIPKRNFIVEPVVRNTAPALGLGASIVHRRDPRAILVCLPADQIVLEQKKFLKSLKAGLEIARDSNCHVTFGIIPTRPETGFGYVERGKQISKQNGVPVFEVKRFIEKPDLKRAQKFLEAKKFFWNSGIFIWRSEFLLSELKRYQPVLYQKLQKIKSDRELRKIYPSFPSISIDYAVMEKASNVRVIPGDFGWADIGSWSAFEHIWPKDASRNASRSRLVTLESSGNIVDGNSKLVALIGVNNLVVVATHDALLVAQKDQVQDVRRIIDILRKRKLTKYL